MRLEHIAKATALWLALAMPGCVNDDEHEDGDDHTDESIDPIGTKDGGSDASLDGSVSIDAGRDAGRDASIPGDASVDSGKVSRPGEYRGYGDKIFEGYELSSLYVPVRDGTKLAVDLYRPKEKGGGVTQKPLPVLWMHTPYNRRWFNQVPGQPPGLSGLAYPGKAATLVEYGYVVAVVDFRGLYASYGKNVGYNRGEWVDAARLDAYDITEWLAVQPWSTGKIGMWGCSATGGSQLQAATTSPPHLVAAFPMSCEFDAYPFGVPGGMAPPKGQPTRLPTQEVPQAVRNTLAEAVDGDADKSQLKAAFASQAGSLDNVGYVPFKDSVAELYPKRWWQVSSPHTFLTDLEKSKVAMYLAANWDEAATKHGAFFSQANFKNPTKLIVGPATHCAWTAVQTATGLDITVEERRFFDYWLKGIDNGVMDEPKVYYYTYNAPKGTEWRASKQWPLATERRTPYYLAAEHGLVTTKPSEASALNGKDEATVDYEITAANLADKGVTYLTAPLTSDLQVTGHPVLELWVSSTDVDGDFIATVQDVAPDGKVESYNVHGRLRASLRKETKAPYEYFGLPYHPSGEADATPLVRNEPAKLAIELLPISQVFKAGHRLRLIVSFAEAPTPRVTPAPRVTLYRDAAHPSALVLPIVPN